MAITGAEFSTEQLEQIRLLVGDRERVINGVIRNIDTDDKIGAQKKRKKLYELNRELRELNGISNVSMSLIVSKIK